MSDDSDSKSRIVYNKKWVSISRFITTLSDNIRDYYLENKNGQAPDHDTMIMSLQLFALICAKKFGYSKEEMDEMWDTSRGIHSIISKDTDTPEKGEVQTYILSKSKLPYRS